MRASPVDGAAESGKYGTCPARVSGFTAAPTLSAAFTALSNPAVEEEQAAVVAEHMKPSWLLPVVGITVPEIAIAVVTSVEVSCGIPTPHAVTAAWPDGHTAPEAAPSANPRSTKPMVPG